MQYELSDSVTEACIEHALGWPNEGSKHVAVEQLTHI
jgi:hypothetical protein